MMEQQQQLANFPSFPRQARQITKNPQNMFQALPGAAGGGGGFNPSPPGGNSPSYGGGRMSNGGGGLSPSFGGGAGDLSRLLGDGSGGGGGSRGFMDTPNSSYGMGGSVSRMEPR